MRVFGIDFKRGIGGLIVWSVVISFIIALGMLFHSIFSSSFAPEALAQRAGSLPVIIRGVLGLQNNPDLSGLYAYAGYLFQFILLLTGIYAGCIGARALSGEEGKGTIEFLYSLPVTRGKILRQKILSGFLRYLIFSVVIYALTCLLIWFFNREMSISGIAVDMIRLLIVILLTGLVYMNIGYFLSALFRSNAESISVMIAIVLVTYVIGIVGGIMGHLGFLVYLSPVHALLPLNVINSGFSIIGLAAAGAAIVLFLIFAVLRYRKKDFIV